MGIEKRFYIIAVVLSMLLSVAVSVRFPFTQFDSNKRGNRIGLTANIAFTDKMIKALRVNVGIVVPAKLYRSRENIRNTLVAL